MTTVYLHPVGLDRHCWQFCGLAGEMVDYPGHGDRAATGFSFEGVADEIAERFAGPLDLIGLSIGVTVAQYLALRHPDRVRSMLLACGGGGGGAGRPDRAEQTMREGMAATLDETLTRWFTATALADLGHPGVAYARQRLLRDDPAGIAAVWAADRDLATPEALAGVTAPVTVLGGRDDIATGEARLLHLFHQMPNARLEVISGPHMLPLERPADFRAAVARHAAWIGEEL